MRTLFTFLILFASLNVLSQEQIKIYEKEITIPTYLVDAPDKVPYFYTGRAYQGAQGRVYPYAFDGNLTDEKKDVVYKGLFIENKFIEICVLPELGGRLYYMIDKSNGYNVIYKNNVIKPSMIGMLGAWISGGIEWNVPHHHRASTFMPTDYELVENKDGSKTIWVGELEIRNQVRWMVGLTMFPDKAVVKVDLKYINQTPLTHQFLIWANTAVHTNENYQVIYPPKTEYATYHRKVDFTGWPISNELYRGYKFDDIDISMWKNTPEGGSFFAWEDQGQFVAGIDHGENAGLCVVGNKNIVIGKKLWTWGTLPRADMWENILTDDDGPYIEIMTGAYSNNQPDYSWCHPYFTKEATMNFMPLKGMNSVKESTLDAAINLEMENESKALIEVHAYAEFKDAEVIAKNGAQTIWSIKSSLSPLNPQSWLIDVPAGVSYYDLSVEVINEENRELVSYHPQKKAGKPIPETVKPAKTPNEIETVEELVFTGLRMEQIYNPSVYPLPYYKEAVKREPKNAFANLRLGSWYLKEGMIEKAEMYLQLAVDRWTTDYTRSKDCETLYLLGLTKLALEKESEAYDNFYRASWDYAWYGASHLQLSMIESKNGNYRTALEHIEKALSVNVNNIRGNEIKLSLLRKLNLNDDKEQQLATLNQIDPLNLYAHGEKLLMDESVLQLFTKKMRGEIQNYLDLAIKLGNIGMYNEASKILKLAENDTNSMVSQNALVFYYLGFYNQMAGNEELGNQYYQTAARQKTDYCFPFRYETEKVLIAAIEVNPDDYKAMYYWGNLLFDHQPEKAIEKWEKSIKQHSGFAMAHRNLAFAADHVENDPQKAKDHIEVAIHNDASEPIYFFEQDNYSVKLGVDAEFRLANLVSAGSVIDHKDNPLARKVYLEILVGRVDDALQTLQNYHFRKVEGVGNIHNSWVNASLIKGKNLLNSGKVEEALNYFESSLEYPRNLDIGQNNKEGQSHYFIGLALENSGKKKQAKEHYKQSVSMDFSINDLYYKGLAYLKLNEKVKAEEVFNGLIEKGDVLEGMVGKSDFFSMFGNQKSDNVRLAEAYALKGLGYWGLNQKDKAENLFSDALKKDPSNFTAKTRLFE